MADFLAVPLLDEKAASKLLGISARTLQRWRRTGHGPAFVRIGGSVRYQRGLLERFAERGLRGPGRRQPDEGLVGQGPLR